MKLTLSAPTRAFLALPVPRCLQDVWADKSDDPEVVLQVLYTFHRLLQHQDARDIMLYGQSVSLSVCPGIIQLRSKSCTDKENLAAGL